MVIPVPACRSNGEGSAGSEATSVHAALGCDEDCHYCLGPETD